MTWLTGPRGGRLRLGASSNRGRRGAVTGRRDREAGPGGGTGRRDWEAGLGRCAVGTAL